MRGLLRLQAFDPDPLQKPDYQRTKINKRSSFAERLSLTDNSLLSQ
jgi:hypothetical protein